MPLQTSFATPVKLRRGYNGEYSDSTQLITVTQATSPASTTSTTTTDPTHL